MSVIIRPPSDWSTDSFSSDDFSMTHLDGDRLTFGTGTFGSILTDRLISFSNIISTFYGTSGVGYATLQNGVALGYNFLLVPYYFKTLWSTQAPYIAKERYIYYNTFKSNQVEPIGIRVAQQGYYEMTFETYVTAVSSVPFSTYGRFSSYRNLNTFTDDTLPSFVSTHGSRMSVNFEITNNDVKLVKTRSLGFIPAGTTIMIGISLDDPIDSSVTKIEMFHPTFKLKRISDVQYTGTGVLLT